MNPSDITFAVINYNRKISNFLESLRISFNKHKNLYQPEDFNLLIIDNNYNNNFSKANNINCGNKPLSQSLNESILYSKTRYVIICSDDIVVKSHLILDEIMQNTITSFCSWSCICIDKRIMPQIGWFDLRFQGGNYDGADCTLRMAERGIKPHVASRGDDNRFVKHDRDDEPGWLQQKHTTKRVEQDAKYFYIKWKINNRFWVRQARNKKPSEIKKLRNIEEIDWFPFWTDLYRKEIWHNGI